MTEITLTDCQFAVLCVAIMYLVGAYMALVVLGATSDDDNVYGADVVAGALWPLTVAFVIIISLIAQIRAWLEENDGRGQRVARTLFFYLTLPLRPWRIGRIIRKWCKGGNQ